MVKALGDGGTHVTFGAAQFEAVRFPTRELIFKDICLKGFWMDRWFRECTRERAQIMFDKLFDLMRKGIVQASVGQVYSLDQYKEALEQMSQPRFGKVLFRMN